MVEKHPRPGPAWWNESHESAWQRVQEALRRDWSQTMADLSGTRGRDLHQTALDTVRQALGTEPLPLFTTEIVPHPEEDHWYRVRHAVRYGYGAYTEYDDHEEWDEDLERKLRAEWDDLRSGPAWTVVKHEVRRGWSGARAEGRRPPPPPPRRRD
jgi:hypothetical protein